MSPKQQSRSRLPKLSSARAWEAAWQKHWKKSGLPGYELPADAEAEFLSGTRTPEKEKARLQRIHDEFLRAFTEDQLQPWTYHRPLPVPPEMKLRLQHLTTIFAGVYKLPDSALEQLAGRVTRMVEAASAR